MVKIDPSPLPYHLKHKVKGLAKSDRIDKSNMRKVILDFPKQFEEALDLAKDIKVEGKFENIIICGMGGSALPANILIPWLNRLTSESSTSLPVLTA